MRRAASAVLAVAALAVLGACGPVRATPRAVVASTSLLADLAAHVVGDRAPVRSLVPPGVPVEDFVPTPRDAVAIASAAVIFLNGKGLDGWATRLLADASDGTRVVTLSDGLPPTPAGTSNPHYFLDVRYAMAYVERIRDTLADADPDGASGYASRAAAYLGELASLDAEIRSHVAAIPSERRALVTSHDAFPFFAAAYGFTLIGFVQGESGKDPSPTDLATLVEKVRAARVPAIFAERALSPRLATTLAREAGVTTVVTDMLTDGVGAPPLDSYVALMRFDVSRIVAALA